AGPPRPHADEIGPDLVLHLEDGGEGSSADDPPLGDEGPPAQRSLGGGEGRLAAVLEAGFSDQRPGDGRAASVGHAEQENRAPTDRHAGTEESRRERGRRTVDRLQDPIEHQGMWGSTRGRGRRRNRPCTLVGWCYDPNVWFKVN